MWDHLHLCLEGWGLDREFQVTLEIFALGDVWSLLSLRQPTVFLSRYLRPWVCETPVSLSQPLLNASTPWWEASLTNLVPSNQKILYGWETFTCLHFFLMCLSLSWGFWLDTLVQTLDSTLVDADLLIPWILLCNASSAVTPHIDWSRLIDWICQRWTPIRVWVRRRNEECKSTRTTLKTSCLCSSWSPNDPSVSRDPPPVFTHLGSLPERESVFLRNNRPAADLQCDSEHSVNEPVWKVFNVLTNEWD